MDTSVISKKIYSIVMIILLVCMLHMPTAIGLALGSETDRLSLLVLKDKITNGKPDVLPSWNDSLHFCEWQGITCSRRHQRVSVLSLKHLNLGGTLAPALGNLTFLNSLNLTDSNLHGEIPKEVGRLKRLQLLYLGYNHLHGKIPIELINCSKLRGIFLHYNNLTGELPSWLGSMVQLNVLSLGANSLVGTIPPSLGNLSSLGRMSFAANNLGGSIPYALGRLSNLKTLLMAYNHLSGVIPSSIYNLSSIESISLSLNQLSGTLPLSIDLAFPNLQNFWAMGNLLNGTIPSSISNISGLQQFEISQNRFSGPIPTTLGRLKNLRLFQIASNNFGTGRAHDLGFLSSLTNCTQLYSLVIQNNSFGGVLPNSVGNLSAGLRMFFMGYNQISGAIPEGIGQLVGLTYLNMQGNYLEDGIPDSIGMLRNLVRVFLAENLFSGNLPSVIGNLTMLTDLHLYDNKLKGSIPSTLRHCTKMEDLYLSYNNFSGDIPNQTFGHMESLVVLSLSYNSLTGLLPSEFGNLKHLVSLFLSENKFFGDIPMELGECIGLVELKMNGNFLQGSIATSLSLVRSLESLDLSRNNLSGTIPDELGSLPVLQSLNLSFNHLRGEIPIVGVFSNITAVSLTGNQDLCGGVPQLKLPACPSLQFKKHKKSIHLKTIFIIIISGVLICAIVFICIYLRKKQKKLSSSPSNSLQNTYLQVSYGELHEATNGFSSFNLVGTGSFGSVYKGTLQQHERPIAVKVLNLQTRGASKCFMAECRALSKVRHPNLLKILTSCSSIDYKGADFKALVFEYMPNGSLENWLHCDEQSGSRNLNLMQRLDIAMDVAHALNYLHHDSELAIAHCDIKPSNILVDDDMIAHLGDFGLARLLHGATGYSIKDQTASSSAIKGTIGYVPPEYGAGGSVSTEGDIYSYGILLLEMLTGKKPTDSMFGEGLNLHKFCKMVLPKGVIEIVDSRLLVPFNEVQEEVIGCQNMLEDKIREMLASFAKVGVACSAEVPNERMGINDVIVELHAIKKQLSAPGIKYRTN